jgi:hypothetical protein
MVNEQRAGSRTAPYSKPRSGVASTAGVRVVEIDLHVLNMRTRMPFRYGIASMTALPHLFVRVEAEFDGRHQTGLASEGLPPKWFTKDPQTTFRSDLADMMEVIRHACSIARDTIGQSVFGWWRQVYEAQQRWGEAKGYPPLLTGLGASLVERAVIDAHCRRTGQSFSAAVRSNSLGLQLGDLHAELGDASPASFLPEQPLRALIARHTVGLADPLTDAEIPPGERLNDGLPQSLEACIRTYGLTHFKLKVSGDLAHDVARLRQIAVAVDTHAPPDYAFTLDGNEQYHDIVSFQEAWRTFGAEPSLRAFMRHLLFVEQPLHRTAALSDAVAGDLLAWADRPPIIIDESDGAIDSLPTALQAGYAGTSYKNCKGVFRGLANACLIAHQQAASPDRPYVISGEDLANVGPVALLQDLAAMATLGVEHVERNGHHYFAGLSMLPQDVQAQVLQSHGDLYRTHAAGFPTLDIRNGRLDAGSVVDAPFGTAFLLDSTQFTPLDEWDFDTLGVDE